MKKVTREDIKKAHSERNSVATGCPQCGAKHEPGDGKITCHHRIYWTCHICGFEWRHGQKYPGPYGPPPV